MICAGLRGLTYLFLSSTTSLYKNRILTTHVQYNADHTRFITSEVRELSDYLITLRLSHLKNHNMLINPRLLSVHLSCLVQEKTLEEESAISQDTL